MLEEHSMAGLLPLLEDIENLISFVNILSLAQFPEKDAGRGTCFGRFAAGCRKKVIVVIIIIKEASWCRRVRAFPWSGLLRLLGLLGLLGLLQRWNRGGTKHISVPCGWRDRTATAVSQSG